MLAGRGFCGTDFKDFEKQTGIKVLPVYDSEAVKTVGLANRCWRRPAIRNATSSGTTKIANARTGGAKCFSRDQRLGAADTARGAWS